MPLIVAILMFTKKSRAISVRKDETEQTAPENYEELIRLIHERHDEMSKTYQRISVFLTQNPNDVAVQSVNAIAERCDIHASSFVRFAQALGYKGFKELQTLFQKRLATAAPGFEARRKALESELQDRQDQSEYSFLRDLIVRDIASLQDILEKTIPEELALAADLIEEAENVYLVGQLRSAPVVELLRYILTMLGKRCILLDAGGGLATHMAKTMKAEDVLIAVSFRFYANEVVNIVEEAEKYNVPVVAISDSTLSPLAKSAKVLFAVPEHDYTFSRSLAAPMCLAQALTVAVAARVQHNTTEPRIPTVTGT
ncbi:MurR/RpiR family transcriptional regulator [Thalassospira xiamenensis]|jgi:DNA-binding MurR/RpiR family transcriptional regulator|uniref:MurR/RpiR family transcriptional regulator n=1 Tax=Thalassospira xiamenensis TaxID=220697 RepID=UPI00241D2984|nr:MurR/RpiR family transcriptional regulator [Thalassospira xiamenensis]|tara:strand:- start:398 stop:1336 length:939 start_codon:yes stop_codon:yes gene_type:complete